METVSTWRTLVQSAMVLAALISSGASKAQAPDANSPAVEKSLKGFLRTLDDNKATLYIAAFRDLNGDGMPEAVVYLMGKSWCGSGGCNTLILARNGNSWRIVTNIRITRRPIRILTKKSHGWCSLGVWVQGGGIQPGYEAELLFNGKSYPRNPSVPPARRLEGNPEGEVVIPSVQDGKLLYDD